MIAEPIQGVGGFTHGPDGLLGAFAKELARARHPVDQRRGADRLGPHRRALLGLAGARPGRHDPGHRHVRQGHRERPVDGRGHRAAPRSWTASRGNSISTFGGSPITAAGALANLRYLLEHDLQGNAAKVGPILLDGLRELGSPIVGDVRGKGLMIGVELVRPGTGSPGEPAPELASAVLEATKRRGLLVGKGGLYGNALRIAPPLTLTAEEAAEGLALLTASIEEVAAGHLRAATVQKEVVSP